MRDFRRSSVSLSLNVYIVPLFFKASKSEITFDAALILSECSSSFIALECDGMATLSYLFAKLDLLPNSGEQLLSEEKLDKSEK